MTLPKGVGLFVEKLVALGAALGPGAAGFGRAVPLALGPGAAALSLRAVALRALALGTLGALALAAGSAPVILPAVLRRPLPYRPAMLVPLVALHTTLALRVLVGDAHGSALAVQVGGVGNILAVLG